VVKKVLFVFFIFYFSWGFSQDEATIAHSNYAPTKTFYLNPTNTLDNKVWLDIHVIGVGVFVQNDLVYFPKEEFSFVKNIIGGAGFSSIQFDLDDSKKYGFLDLDVQLLSGSFQYKEHGFALGIKARGMLDFRNISTEIGQLLTEGPESISNATERVNVEANKMFINQMMYAEFAFSYSNLYYHRDHTSMALGITAKYLMGIAGAAIKIDKSQINVQGDPETDFVSLNGSAAYGAPSVLSSGKGVAVDLGFVYKNTLDNVSHYEPFFKSNSCRPYEYKYKLSASLIDLGFILFNSEAKRYDFESNLILGNLGENSSISGVGDFSSGLLQSNSETNKFNMYTPVAINLMGDYNFENNFYASAQFISGIFRQFSFGVKRPAILAVSGRYQRKWFEASAKISAYERRGMRLGLGLRFAYFTIGSDNLLSYFGVQDFTGTDLYFNLRFFFGKKPGCGNKRKDKNRKNRNATKCVKH
jgi:hypothetical protein